METRLSMPARIFDCVIFNGEFDLLSLRMRELDSIVDVIVVVEGSQTFAGSPKQLQFSPDHPLVLPFRDKIRYVVVDDFPAGDAWSREAWQRNAMQRGLEGAQPDDLILMSDVDELIRKEAAVAARDLASTYFGFQMGTYYFYMNFKNILGHPNMVCAVASKFRGLADRSPNELRYAIRKRGVPAHIFSRGGWHYSYMMDEAAIRRKIRSFSHQEFNKEIFLKAISIRRVVREKADLFSRPGFVWDIVQERDIPDTIREHPEEFRRYFIETGRRKK
jgi:hypothetical protein